MDDGGVGYGIDCTGNVEGDGVAFDFDDQHNEFVCSVVACACPSV